MGEQATNADFLNTSGNNVTPEYFDTMGIRIVAGRAFTASEADAKPPRVVVNEAVARQLFGRGDPVGKLIGSSFRGPPKADWQIIGVVRDAKYRSLREPMIPTIYQPWQDSPSQRINLYVRTRMRPDSIIEPVRRILAQLDPALPFTEIDTMSEEIDASTAPERLTASLASIFAALAAILAAIGIYVLLAYVVAQGGREIGIRIALGARALDVAEMIGWQAVAMSVAGIVIGLGAALFTAPLVRALLYGVAPLDPVSFTLAAAFVLIVTIAASAIPAVRAARTDPATALRQDWPRQSRARRKRWMPILVTVAVVALFLLLPRAASATPRARRGLPGVQMIPVQDRVEAQEIRALCLPSPERTQCEQNDVPLAHGRVDDQVAIGDGLTAGERSTQQHVVRIRRELHHHARPLRLRSADRRDHRNRIRPPRPEAARASTRFRHKATYEWAGRSA